ncbi:TetR/AcrR family transcriptional regulator [Limosilactobacillus mucosae]|uniref:TetR/AcrR family transcriptional regulator n=1 Tax=Limosilactobacillus mucosae TaxID=97478 RepID=UPI00399509BF
MRNKSATDEKIMQAFELLVEQQGYSATTTVQLARTAGVNESTIFRHFGDKLGLASELIIRYRKNLIEVMTDFKPVWDLENDLISFSRHFRQQWPKQHVMVMLMSTVKDPIQKQKLHVAMHQVQKSVQTQITQYLVKMQRLGRIRADLAPEQIALNFMWLNIGQFWSSRFMENEQYQISDERFYELSIRPFANLLMSAVKNNKQKGC